SLDLTTTFGAYDVFGNVLEVTNPRGFTWLREVNLLNLVTGTETPAPFAYEVGYVHDGNNNLVEVQVQNVVPTDTNGDGVQDPGEQASVVAHAAFAHTFSYTSANRLARQDLDAYDGSAKTVTTTWEYDRKQLRVGMRQHE